MSGKERNWWDFHIIARDGKVLIGIWKRKCSEREEGRVKLVNGEEKSNEGLKMPDVKGREICT